MKLCDRAHDLITGYYNYEMTIHSCHYCLCYAICSMAIGYVILYIWGGAEVWITC